MQELHLVGYTTDRRHLIFSARQGAKSGSYLVPVDDDLVAAVDELAAAAEAAGDEVPDEPVHVEPAAPRVEAQLSVREVQARLRAGEQVERIAADAGVDAEWVERFAAPVRAEQRQIIERAMRTHMHRARAGASSVPLRRAVAAAMAERGVTFTAESFDAAWSSRLVGADHWTIEFHYTHRSKARTAEWTYDAASQQLTTNDRTASQIGFVSADDDVPPESETLPGGPGPATTLRTATGGGGSAKPGTARPSTSAQTSTGGSRRSGTPEGKSAPEKRAARKKATSKKRATTKKRAATKKKASPKKKAAPKKKATPKKKAAPKKAAPKKRAATKKKAAPRKKAATKRKTAGEKRPATEKRAAKKKAAPAKAPATEKAAPPADPTPPARAATEPSPRPVAPAEPDAADRPTSSTDDASPSTPEQTAPPMAERPEPAEGTNPPDARPAERTRPPEARPAERTAPRPPVARPAPAPSEPPPPRMVIDARPTNPSPSAQAPTLRADRGRRPEPIVARRAPAVPEARPVPRPGEPDRRPAPQRATPTAQFRSGAASRADVAAANGAPADRPPQASDNGRDERPTQRRRRTRQLRAQ